MNKSTKKKTTRNKLTNKKTTRKNIMKKGGGKTITSIPSDILKYQIPDLIDINKLRQTNKDFLDIYNTPLSNISSLNYISSELHNIMKKESDIHKNMNEIKI